MLVQSVQLNSTPTRDGSAWYLIRVVPWGKSLLSSGKLGSSRGAEGSQATPVEGPQTYRLRHAFRKKSHGAFQGQQDKEAEWQLGVLPGCLLWRGDTALPQLVGDAGGPWGEGERMLIFLPHQRTSQQDAEVSLPSRSIYLLCFIFDSFFAFMYVFVGESMDAHVWR